MRKLAAFLIVAGPLLGCSGPNPPIVDMAGVDPVKYNRDLADCKNTGEWVALGNYIAKCMTERYGYRVLAVY